jgi:integrase
MAAIPAWPGTQPVRRPYDLRHAALSLWLVSSGAPPAEVAARAGHSAHVLLTVYAHCIPGHDQIASQHIARALRASPGHTARIWPRNPCHPGRSRPSCVRVTAGLNGTLLGPARPGDHRQNRR